MLSVEIKINDKAIECYEAVRVLTKVNRADIDPNHKHVYRVRHVTGPHPHQYRYVTHRYGDGAAVLAQKVMEIVNNTE